MEPIIEAIDLMGETGEQNESTVNDAFVLSGPVVVGGNYCSDIC